jgi:hypothetical protein
MSRQMILIAGGRFNSLPYNVEFATIPDFKDPAKVKN